ncbi:MAG: LVIVD repeat-containing protein [Thermoplasmatota archaeon]
MRAVAVVALLVSLVGAGCLSDEGGDPSAPVGDGRATFDAVVPPEPDFDFSTVIEPDHGGHSVPSLHQGGHGLSLTGHVGVGDLLPLTTRGSITSIDVWQDYAVVSGMEGGLAFAIVDISDPGAPEAIGWAPSAADGWTARFSDDGKYVFYGCQMLNGLGYAPSAVIGTCEDPDEVHAPNPPVGNPVLPPTNPAGVSVWDVSDKSNPKFVTFTAIGGSHNIYVANITGVDYVFTSSVEILKFDRANASLDPVADLPGTHDVTVVQHPITQDWLLFTGTGELAIYEVNNPADPQIVFEGTGNEGWTGWHDQVLVPGVVDGKAILLLSGESLAGTGGEALPDIVSVVDLTNPAEPELLSQWQPPFAPLVPWASYLYSVHEMAATPTGQVAIAWYHAGVWVIDVSTQTRQGGPVTLAVYQPHEEIDVVPSTFVQTPLPYVPMVWGAGWSRDGHLVIPDMHTGVYLLEPSWGLHPALDSGQ